MQMGAENETETESEKNTQNNTTFDKYLNLHNC